MGSSKPKKAQPKAWESNEDVRKQAGQQLTLKQRDFVAYYLEGHKPVEAARLAGYSNSVAKNCQANILDKPEVAAYLEWQLEQREKRSLVKADQILEDLYETAEKCMGRKPVPKVLQWKSGEVQEVEVYDFDSAGANKALELLGKHLQLFTDKVQHQHEHVSFHLDLQGEGGHGEGEKDVTEQGKEIEHNESPGVTPDDSS